MTQESAHPIVPRSLMNSALACVDQLKELSEEMIGTTYPQYQLSVKRLDEHLRNLNQHDTIVHCAYHFNWLENYRRIPLHVNDIAAHIDIVKKSIPIELSSKVEATFKALTDEICKSMTKQALFYALAFSHELATITSDSDLFGEQPTRETARELRSFGMKLLAAFDYLYENIDMVGTAPHRDWIPQICEQLRFDVEQLSKFYSSHFSEKMPKLDKEILPHFVSVLGASATTSDRRFFAQEHIPVTGLLSEQSVQSRIPRNVNGPKRVVIVSPYRYGIRDGIGDYSYNLAHALRKQGVLAYVYTAHDWNNYAKVEADIKSLNPDVVDIQFPSDPYFHSATPAKLFNSPHWKGVCTIHEFSACSHIRGWENLFRPFIKHPNRLVFTSEGERADAAIQYLDNRILNFSEVAHIGSNIPISAQSLEKEGSDVVAFTQFRPGKGIQEVVEVAQVIYEKMNQSSNYESFKDVTIHLIGRRRDEQNCREILWDALNRVYGKPGFFNNMSNEEIDNACTQLKPVLPIQFHFDKLEAEVSELLSKAPFGLCLNDEGISSRCSSLIAMIQHKNSIIGTKCNLGKDAMRMGFVTVDCKDRNGSRTSRDVANDVVSRLATIIEMHPRSHEISIQAVEKMRETFDWGAIAKKKNAMYGKLCSKGNAITDLALAASPLGR